MDDFKKLPKMQCFKTGGSVKPKAMCYGGKMKKGGEVDAADIKQDKAIVKKAIKMHDAQEHKGEHTDLSKLRKGGRAKKDCGTVRKYKAGGGVYGAKKTDADIKSIDKAKNFKPEMLCGGKSVKKYNGEDGSYVTKTVDAVKSVGNDLKDKILGTPEQNRIAQEQMDNQATAGSKLAKMLGGKMRPVPMPSVPERAPTVPMPTTSGNENAPSFLRGKKPMKRGGKAC